MDSQTATNNGGPKAYHALDLDNNNTATKTPRSGRHSRFWCGLAACLAVLVIAALIITILALTVLKPRNPDVMVRKVTVKNFQANINPLALKVLLNVSIVLDVVVYNPNHAGFRFSNSTALILYRGLEVGDASIPAGDLGARSSIEFNTTVKILADRLLSKAGDLLRDAISGKVSLTTSARIAGRVNVLNVFKHHAVSSSVCNITISVPDGDLVSQKCSKSLKL